DVGFESILGRSFYARWLANASPEVQRMFVNVPMERQHGMFMAQVRSMLFGSVASHAVSLAHMHSFLPIQPEDLRVCHQYLLETIRDSMGEAWTEEFDTAWETFFRNLFECFYRELLALEDVTEPTALLWPGCPLVR